MNRENRRFAADLGWIVAGLLIPVVILVIVPEPTKLQMMILRLVSAIAVSSVAAHAVNRLFRSSVGNNMRLAIRFVFLAVGFFSLDLWVIPALQWTARGSDRPQIHYRDVLAKGAELMRAGDYEGAQAFYAAQCPGLVTDGGINEYTYCILQQSEAALRGAQLETAREALVRAASRLPEDSSLQGTLQEMRARIELTAARTGDDTNARKAAAAALDQAFAVYTQAEDPIGRANIWLRRADLQLLTEDLEQAEQCLVKAADLYREHGQQAGLAATEQLHGDLATQQQRYDVAQEHYQQALTLYQELGDQTAEAGVTAALGRLLLAKGEHDAAGQRLEKASKIFAEAGNSDLEKILQVQQKTVEANKPPKKLTFDEQVASARSALAAKEFERAEQLLRQATDDRPGDVDALTLLARVLMQDDKWAEAEAVLIRVLALEPDHPVANNNLGLCEMKQGEYKQAKKRFERALVGDDTFAPAVYNLALVNKKLGQKRQAKQVAKKFKKIRPESKQSRALHQAGL